MALPVNTKVLIKRINDHIEADIGLGTTAAAGLDQPGTGPRLSRLGRLANVADRWDRRGRNRPTCGVEVDVALAYINPSAEATITGQRTGKAEIAV